MEKKNGIVSALTDSVKTKKHITTKIEYFCNDTDDAERVFEKVTDILSRLAHSSAAFFLTARNTDGLWRCIRRRDDHGQDAFSFGIQVR